jgi:hypothetical protein
VSSKERLCVACGSYIVPSWTGGPWRRRILVQTADGPVSLWCWTRTGGPFYRMMNRT